MPRTIRMIIEEQEPLTCPAKTRVREAALLMKKTNVGAIMVVDNGKLVGIFTERDALVRVTAEGRDAENTLLSEVMTHKPQTIHPDKPFSDALFLMHQSGFRHVPVVENGRPIGMVSTRDAFGAELSNFLREFVRQEQFSHLLT